MLCPKETRQRKTQSSHITSIHISQSKSNVINIAIFLTFLYLVLMNQTLTCDHPNQNWTITASQTV